MLASSNGLIQDPLARGGFDWAASALGEPATWPPALRLAVDLVFNTPLPMLLAWGQTRAVVYNQAYADLAGPRHPPPPGAHVPAMLPAVLAADPGAFARALGGEVQYLARHPVSLLRAQGPESVPCDLHLTPVRDGDGAVAGVLCAVGVCTEAQAGASAASGLRVLVVEDNLDSQYLVCEMLKAFGHEAAGIAHGEGALAMLQAAPYDVLFSDVSLPGMSGVELARQALQHQPRLKVIFASGYGDALLRHVEFAFQSLQKPYDLEHLQAVLTGIQDELGRGAAPA